MGIYLSDHDHDCLTNLRFADDVLLIASSKEQLQKMLCEFERSTETVGLRIHPEKTNILRKPKLGHKKRMEVDDMKIEILTRGESVRYLGQTMTFMQQETIEIKNRIRAAWATFHKCRQELTSKKPFAQTSPTVRRSNNSDDMLAHREHGHPPKSMKECYNRRNAKCSVSPYKQREDTKRS